MTITLNAWWLHGLATVAFLIQVARILAYSADYDFGAPLRLMLPIVLYMGYWIAYLALTR